MDGWIEMAVKFQTPFVLIEQFSLVAVVIEPDLNLMDKCLDGVLNNNNYESEVLQVGAAVSLSAESSFDLIYLFRTGRKMRK